MPEYGRPFFLTGHFGRPLSGISLPDLWVQWGLGESAAAMLRDVAASHASIAICAEASGAGKTLLLEALLAARPPVSCPIFLRGTFERFTFLHDVTCDRSQAILIANEVSGFEDVYLWGEQAKRALSLAADGWTLWCTAHAGSAADLTASWIDAELVASVADLPERLVVISLLGADTEGRRALRFETLARGVLIDSRQW